MNRFAYPKIAARLFDRPLAIDPEPLKVMLDRMGERIIFGFDFDGDEAPVNEERPRLGSHVSFLSGGTYVNVGNGMSEYFRSESGIAVIPVLGPLSQRFDWIAALCGMTTYDALRVSLGTAHADPMVKGILMDFDSPGGEATGMFDLADFIFSMRDAGKPIWGNANGLAASAAYGLISATSRVTLPRMGFAGSIGVVAVHADYSEQDKEDGVKYTAIYSGKRKIDGWDHAPLTEAARKGFQTEVDRGRELFAGLISKHGRLNAKAAMATEAAMFADSNAVEENLADAVLDFEDTYRELEELVTNSRSSMSKSTAQTVGIKEGDSTMKLDGSATGTGPVNDKQDDKRSDTATTAAPPPSTVAPPPATTAAPSPAPAPDATAVAAADESKRVTEIVDLCTLAGVPLAQASDFIKDKTMSTEKVRERLLQMKADVGGRTSDIDTSHNTNTNAQGAAAWAGIHERVNKMHGIEPKRVS